MEHGRIIAARFQLDAPVEAGGMGHIFKARDVRDDTWVALKLVPLPTPTTRERFRRETALLSQLSHPNLVRYLSHGELDDGQGYLVMEWVDGLTLDAHLRTCGLTLEETRRLGLRLAQALSHVHSFGIVHRDVTPRNVLLREGDVDRATLIDFGIARTESLGPTRSGVVVGTLGYMSPEQARGELELTGRSDLFSLGCLLYEALTGTQAFTGPHPPAIHAKILLVDPPPPRALNPTVPAPLDALVLRMLEKQSRMRPRDAGEVTLALAQLEPLDDTRRVTVQGASTAVTQSGGEPAPAPPGRFWVVVGPRDPDEETVQHGAALKRLEHEGFPVELTAQGYALIRVEGAVPAAGLAVRAVRLALRIEAEHPTLQAAVSAETSPQELSETIDVAVETLIQESLRSLFASALTLEEREGVRVDATSAELLEGELRVERRPHGIYARER